MKTTYTDTRVPKIPKARIAILQSKWYSEHTDRMVKKCVEVLVPSECLPPEVHILPGALELPLAAQTLIRSAAKHQRYEAVICIGAIMKGETLHFDMIVDECIRGLGQVMLQEGVPIIVEVLPVSSIEQLAARSGDNSDNKGIEAAQAAAEIVFWRRKVAGSSE